VQTAILKNAFYRVGQGALGMGLWNQGGGGPKKFGNHWFKLFHDPSYVSFNEEYSGSVKWRLFDIDPT
jgi:hypothetical protein